MTTVKRAITANRRRRQKRKTERAEKFTQQLEKERETIEELIIVQARRGISYQVVIGPADCKVGGFLAKLHQSGEYDEDALQAALRNWIDQQDWGEITGTYANPVHGTIVINWR